MAVVGVDACKSGWIAVVLSENTRRALYLREIGELAQAIPDAEVVAIDIPIGLPTINRRIADDLARDYVGGRRSSVFYVLALTPFSGHGLSGLLKSRGVG